jgi:hypothetical protein
MESREPQTTAGGHSLKLLSQRQYPLTTLNLNDLTVETDGGKMFQYNTTIVDLNPFENRDTRVSYSKSHPDLTTATVDSRFRTENALMFNKIVSQKKFLINRNLRFYEPVQDAKERHQIMANFDTLRTKLVGSQTKNYNTTTPPPQTHQHDDKDEYYTMKNISYKHKDLIESFKNLHNQSSNSSEKLNDIDKTNMFKSQTMSSFEEKYVPIKVFNTKKKQHLVETTKEQSVRLPSSRKDSNVTAKNQQPPVSESRSTHYTDLADVLEKHQEIIQPSIEKTTNNRYDDFTELKRFSRYHTNLTRKSLQNTKATTEKKAQKYLIPSESVQDSNPFDSNNTTKLDNNLNSNEAKNLLVHSNPLSKRINHAVRKSSKCRLENIYKPEKIEAFKSLSKKSTENLSILSPNVYQAQHANIAANATNFKIDPSTTVNPQTNNNLLFHKPAHFAEGNESTLPFNDPNCNQFQTMNKSTSLQNVQQTKSKKEFPHERYQRIKKAEVQTVENIIGDIPSTLHVSSFYMLRFNHSTKIILFIFLRQ